MHVPFWTVYRHLGNNRGVRDGESAKKKTYITLTQHADKSFTSVVSHRTELRNERQKFEVRKRKETRARGREGDRWKMIKSLMWKIAINRHSGLSSKLHNFGHQVYWRWQIRGPIKYLSLYTPHSNRIERRPIVNDKWNCSPLYGNNNVFNYLLLYVLFVDPVRRTKCS